MATGSSASTDQERLPDSRPRILYVITLAEVGGAGTYLASLLPYVKAAGFDVAVAAHGDGPLRSAAHVNGVPFYALQRLRRPIHPVRDVAAVVELAQLCRRLSPDVVHVNSSKAGILGRIAATVARVPIRIFTVHGWSFATQAGLVRHVYLRLERVACRLTTTTICVAAVDRELGLRHGVCHAETTRVIHNGVPETRVLARRDAHHVPHVVAVGRLQRPQKDFQTLVWALAMLRDAPFTATIVGDGPDHGSLAAEIERHGLDGRVRLAGELTDVSDILASADVFVLPTTYESLPMSILEAMAAGLPVVASNVGGVPELVVDGRTGLLVPPRDVPALAEALRALLSDAARRRSMGEAGREQAVRAFGVERSAAAHVRLYRELLSAERSSRGARESRRRATTSDATTRAATNQK
jgi:glycosyltransferase involved in cell wall biosynthesis